LAGIALSNGWIDARVKVALTIDYAYWHGMPDEFLQGQFAYGMGALHQVQ
jgi:hypothetical protein